MAKDRKGNFKRLAEARMVKTIQQIRLIGNLSDTSNYIYTDAQAEKIVARLEEEVAKVRQLFDHRGDTPQFSLDADG